MTRIICWARAIPFWVRSGIWCPHVYKEETREPAIIISTTNSFRVSDNYVHNPNETVHPKATLIKSKCVCCGKEERSWFDGEIPIIGV